MIEYAQYFSIFCGEEIVWKTCFFFGYWPKVTEPQIDRPLEHIDTDLSINYPKYSDSEQMPAMFSIESKHKCVNEPKGVT